MKRQEFESSDVVWFTYKEEKISNLCIIIKNYSRRFTKKGIFKFEVHQKDLKSMLHIISMIIQENVFEKDMLEVYDLDGKLLGIVNRKEFYNEIKEEFKKTGKITKKIKSIRLLLMNSRGKIYITRRSEEKERNGGLYDKTIGGHVKAGHTWNLTVVKECHEELGFPAVVLTDDEFRNAVDTSDLRIIGLFRRVEHIENFLSISRTGSRGEFYKQPFITSFYFGYYDGPINFYDGESTGVEVFTLEKLEKMMSHYPEKFTEDLKFMIKKYKEYITPVKKQAEEVKGFDEEINTNDEIKELEKPESHIM